MFCEVASIKSRVFLCRYDFLDHGGDFLELLRWRLVSNAHGEYHSSLIHSAKVAHAALQKIGVRHDNLFPRQTAQARALDADMLHSSQKLVDDQKVSDVEERFVESNRKARQTSRPICFIWRGPPPRPQSQDR